MWAKNIYKLPSMKINFVFQMDLSRIFKAVVRHNIGTAPWY